MMRVLPDKIQPSNIDPRVPTMGPCGPGLPGPDLRLAWTQVRLQFAWRDACLPSGAHLSLSRA